MAVSSANRIRLKSHFESGNRSAGRAISLIEHFDTTHTTILIGNNIVNIGCASIGTILFTNLMGPIGGLVSTVVITVLVLIFGEIIPKNIAKKNAEAFICTTAGILSFFKLIFSPIVYPFYHIKQRRKTKNSDNDADITPTVTEDELKYIIDEISEEGVLQQEETKLVHSALEFDDTYVYDIFTPRVDMKVIDIDDEFDVIKGELFESRHSRIPVYRDSVDNIIGIIYKSEFFALCAMNKEFKLEDVLHDVLYVPSTVKISVLLRTLQRDKIHMAVVADEHGGTMGIITMEDILEELVGEIWDESDEVEYPIVEVSENLYEVSGDADLYDLFEQLGINSDNIDTDARSVGGFVMEHLQKIPAAGDSFQYGSFVFTVIDVQERRILKASVEKVSIEDSIN